MWVQDLAALTISVEDPVYRWLQHEGLLSAALQKCCTDLSVQVLSQEIRLPLDYEQHALGLDNLANTWIRQVNICGDQTPWIFARVTAPLSTYLHYQNALDKLDNNLLGATFLSKQQNVIRSQFKFLATPTAIENTLSSGKWARLSVFSIDRYDLLVTEVFLDEMPSYPA